MQFIIDLIAAVAGKLEETAHSDVVVGEPITIGGVTVVPLSRLTVALGGMAGEGEGDAPSHKRHRGGKGKGKGEVAALGARVRPVAVAIFSADGVEVLPIADKKGVLDKIMEKVPDVIELVKKAQEKKAA
jgi:uncharacterized spore protein YtfJ